MSLNFLFFNGTEIVRVCIPFPVTIPRKVVLVVIQMYIMCRQVPYLKQPYVFLQSSTSRASSYYQRKFARPAHVHHAVYQARRQKNQLSLSVVLHTAQTFISSMSITYYATYVRRLSRAGENAWSQDWNWNKIGEPANECFLTYISLVSWCTVRIVPWYTSLPCLSWRQPRDEEKKHIDGVHYWDCWQRRLIARKRKKAKTCLNRD